MAATSSLHIAMFPWFAFGHLAPYLQTANKLAKKGHKISFLIPSKTQVKLQPFNHFPNLITFVPIIVPHVDGLPEGAETTADVSNLHEFNLIMTAMDLTQPQVKTLLQHIKPHVIFFDFTFWIPKLASQLGIKSIYYSVISATTFSYVFIPTRQVCGPDFTVDEFMQPPLGLETSAIKLHSHEVKNVTFMSNMIFGSDVRFFHRHFTGLCESDAIAFKACGEIEGPFVDFLISEFKKPVLLSGPFLAVLKLPVGVDTVTAALPDGFEERVEGRGVVYGGWVQQQHILEHPSIGCFVTHCGAGSLSEALVKKCQLVLLPHVGDHFFRARTLSSCLKVGVEVEKREDDGFFTKESVCEAVKTLMDEGNERGKEIRATRAKLRELLLDKDLEESYIINFIHNLQSLVG